MNNILSEKEYQHFIMDLLSQDNGYVIRKATSYDRFFTVDREMLFQFLNDTQPDAMAALRRSIRVIWRILLSTSSTPRSPRPMAACWMS